jgi:hypothetical protein
MLRVEDYILNLPQEKKEIYLILREIVHETLPKASEKLSYGIPFFYLNKPLCYIHQHKNGVDLSFVRGYAFTNYGELLEKRDRKMVRSLHYKGVNDIDVLILKEILTEASNVDSRM